jgi:hypothetical protein
MKRLTIFIILLLVVLVGCGAPARTQVPVTVVAEQRQEVEAVVQTVAVALPTASAAFLATAAPVSDSTAVADTSALSFAPAGSGLVIKDAELELLVRDSDTALAQVTQMASDYGGYIISAQTWYVDGFKHASLRLGIPSVAFEKALNQLRGLALQVLRENATGQDVSAEYNDLQSRLTNLEATAARVREFLADAKTVEESLRISRELAQLETQIEQIKGQMRFYEGRAAFSTVTVYITPQYPTPTPSLTPTPTATPTATPTPTSTPAWDPGDTFGEASGVLKGMTQSTVDALIWLAVVAGPPILILVLFFGGLRWLLRRRA